MKPIILTYFYFNKDRNLAEKSRFLFIIGETVIFTAQSQFPLPFLLLPKNVHIHFIPKHNYTEL